MTLGCTTAIRLPTTRVRSRAALILVPLQTYDWLLAPHGSLRAVKSDGRSSGKGSDVADGYVVGPPTPDSEKQTDSRAQFVNLRDVQDKEPLLQGCTRTTPDAVV